MRFLPRFQVSAPPRYRRPPDLLYASHESPPAMALAGLVLQHTVTALAFITYVLAAAQIAGLGYAETQNMVTATLLGMAIATFLQSWGSRTGSSQLVVHIPDPLLVVTGGLIVARYGPGGLVIAGIVNALIALGAGYLVPRLRTVLTPTVAGVVICIAGVSLIVPGLKQTTGLTAEGIVDSIDILIAATTLGVIVLLSIWGSKRGKLFALLAGLIAGIALAAICGRIDGLDAFMHTPVFGLPHLPKAVFMIDPGVLAAIALLALMTQLDVFGCVVLMHKMNDADWRRPDMKLVAGGMRATALGNFFAAWFGAQATAISSANIALSHISRTTSRIIGLFIGLVLAVLAFLPKFALALTLIPTPVIGAVGLYAAAYLIVSGIELITSRAMDSRVIFMVGLAFIAGIGVMMMPELANIAPTSLQFMLANGIIVAGVTAIILNLIFRIGTSQHVAQQLDHQSQIPLAHQIVNFVETSGARWNARRDAIQRAASAALEAAEALQASDPQRLPIEIRGHFDEYNLNIELVHKGPVLSVSASTAPTPHNLLDLDDDQYNAIIEQTLTTVSHRLLTRLADHVSSGTDKNTSWLRLHFEH